MTNDTNNNPAKYHRNCVRHAEKLRIIGATKAELALHFGVDFSTIERWADVRASWLARAKVEDEQEAAVNGQQIQIGALTLTYNRLGLHRAQ